MTYMRKWIGSGDLPLASDTSSRFMLIVITAMVFLAALALATALMLDRLAARWEYETQGGATIEIDWEETIPQSQREIRIARAMDWLVIADGVIHAERVTAEQTGQLLEPWLGDDLPLDALPIPDLIELDLEADAQLQAIEIGISGFLPGARIVPHSDWLKPLNNLAHFVRLAALSVVGLMLMVTIVMVSFSTRAGLAIMADMVELLHNMGANDQYIAAEFQRHALIAGFKGGVIGLVIAVIMILGMGVVIDPPEGSLLPQVGLQPGDWVWMALLPLIAAFSAMMAARHTVLRRLGDMV